MSQVSSARTDVIVIGAGFSGITAARDLEAAGLSVRVIEARDRVGGRALRGMIGGQIIDHGGQWIGADNRRFRAIAAEHGIDLYPQFTKGETLLEVNGEVQRVGKGLPRLPLSTFAELGVQLAALNHKTKSLPP